MRRTPGFDTGPDEGMEPGSVTGPAVPPGGEDGIDWAEVAWADREMRGELPCCDSRDHRNGTDDDVQCPCPEHPQSYLHPNGEKPWPRP
jgi:hypothetical protein